MAFSNAGAWPDARTSSVSTRHAPPATLLGGEDRLDDLVARVEAADGAALRRKEEEIRELFAFADPGVDPISDEITP